MIMTIDVGNTTITGAVYKSEKLVLTFRRSTNPALSSDEIGVFLRDVLEMNGVNFSEIKEIACCSVVPGINHSLSNAFVKYFGKEALFLQAGVKTGLKLKYGNPKEIGSDRIAAAVGAVSVKPEKNIIVVDMGTATTIDVITSSREYLGGAILSGVAMSVRSLSSGTAQLPSVEVLRPEKVLGSSTIEAIQSGVYYGHAGAVKELCAQFQKNVFGGEKPYIIGTGGFSSL